MFAVKSPCLHADMLYKHIPAAIACFAGVYDDFRCECHDQGSLPWCSGLSAVMHGCGWPFNFFEIPECVAIALGISKAYPWVACGIRFSSLMCFFSKSPSRKAITMAGWLFPCWIGTEPEPWYCFLGGCLSAWFCSICAVIQPNCTFNLLSGLALHHQWRAWSLFGFARAGRDITQSHEPWRATSCCLSPMCLRLAVIKVIQGVWTRL